MTVLSNRITISTNNTIAKNILLAFLGSIIISISTQIMVPMFPVPMTMQTFAVLCVGMSLGSRWGSISTMMYLAQGAMGLPVFAGGKFGLITLFGPTGGYLFGYVFSAFVVGYMAEKGWNKSFIKIFTAMLASNAVLYTLGLIQLGIVVGWDKPILEWGLYPFILGMLAKTTVASGLFSKTIK
ncbi:MAG: biotin transporter BioY [Alphaproteobacteria bacterium]|nr:biotin transporter BioY [Alphaproteobacteria bacterium]